MLPSEFHPVFDDTVREYWGNHPESAVAINPQYCLSLPSAKILAGFFYPPPVIYLAPPIRQAPGSPFNFNHSVPWFRFQSDVERNAGQLAIYWDMPGVPRSSVMNEVNLDVQTPVEG